MSIGHNVRRDDFPDVEWDDGVYAIHARDKMRAVGTDRTLLLMHDPNRSQDHLICNISRPDGLVCRMLKGHDGAHVPFSGEHISVTGVYVVAESWDQRTDRA